MAEFLPRLQSDQVITLGTMREGLGDLAHLTTKSNKAELAKPFRFARTRDNLLYLPGVPAPCAIDFDTGGITQSVTDKIAECGGLLGAIEYLCPDFKSAAYLSRGSSTAGLTFTETGEVYPGGEHHLVILADGSQSKQFIDVMFDRAWLAGMGWIQVGLGGQLMTRSIFDRCVWDAARLLFEADPTLGPGLTQAPRTVTVHDGGRLSFVRLP
jgi:hypothetical protein